MAFDKNRGFWSRVCARVAAWFGSPRKKPQSVEPSIGDAIDMAMVGQGAKSPTPIETVDDGGGPEELFASIAATYSQPVKDFISEVKRGTATHEWVEICMPVMGSIIEGAQSLELHEVAQRMVEFRDTLTEFESMEAGTVFDAAARQLILERYDALVEALPQTFDGGEENRRDSIIIHGLLRQVPDVGRVTLEKLYAAGLTSLATLYLANPGDMSAATGVPPWLCERICEKVTQHRQQLQGESAEHSNHDRRARLAALLDELQRHQEELRQISGAARPASGTGADKRACIRRRQACALQINVLLAEMDELQIVEEFRSLSIDQRIQRLEQYLGSEPAGTPAPDAVPSHPSGAR